MWPGRTEEKKKQITRGIVKVIKDALDLDEESISLSIEEVPEKKWAEEVYKPDIIEKENLLYKKPGYRID